MKGLVVKGGQKKKGFLSGVRNGLRSILGLKKKARARSRSRSGSRSRSRSRSHSPLSRYLRSNPTPAEALEMLQFQNAMNDQKGSHIWPKKGGY
jgi:hypothetical protein